MLSNRERNLVSEPPLATVDVSTRSLADRYGVNHGHRVILYAGTFESYQGLDLLVEAAAEVVRSHKNVRFLCAGGNDKQVARMKVLTKKCGVSEYFSFPGTLPLNEAESLLRIANILISPRITGTNTPLKIYSYLRSGVPILATKIVSHTQVLTDDVALLVEPRPEGLSSGVLRLLDDSGLCRRLAENAVRLAEKSYSEAAYYRKIAEVFSFLASKSR
jgi:glycosyltransferase involved in cell wall biosynthesis